MPVTGTNHLDHDAILSHLESIGVETSDDGQEGPSDSSSLEIKSTYLERFNELFEEMKKYITDSSQEKTEKTILLQAIEPSFSKDEQYKAIRKELVDLVKLLVGTRVLGGSVEGPPFERKFTRVGYNEVRKRLGLEYEEYDDYDSFLESKFLSSFRRPGDIYNRVPDLIKICKEARDQGDQEFQEQARAVLKILNGDFKKFQEYQNESFDDSEVQGDKKWYLDRFKESLQAVGKFWELSYVNKNDAVSTDQNKFIKRIYQNDVLRRKLTDKIFFEEIAPYENTKKYLKNSQETYGELFSMFFDIDIDIYNYLFALEETRIEHPVFFSYIFENSTRRNVFFDAYDRQSTTLVLLSSFASKWLAILIPKPLLTSGYEFYYDFLFRYYCGVASNTGDGDITVLERKVFDVIPFRKARFGPVVPKSTVFSQLGENQSFYRASFEERRATNPMFNFFGNLLASFMTIRFKDQDEQKRILQIILGKGLPKKYNKIKKRKLSPYRVICDYWEVLLSEVEPVILEFGKQILKSNKLYKKESRDDRNKELLGTFDKIYRSMVKKRIYNDPTIKKQDIFPDGLVETVFSEVREELGEDNAFELLDSFNLAFSVFREDPMFDRTAAQTPIQHLLAHPKAPEQDRLALERLFGVGQASHPSMLLDQTFLAGPQDQPNYLQYRNKVLAIVKHQVGESFMQDLEKAVELKKDPSKRKEVQKLAKSLVKRFTF